MDISANICQTFAILKQKCYLGIWRFNRILLVHLDTGNSCSLKGHQPERDLAIFAWFKTSRWFFYFFLWELQETKTHKKAGEAHAVSNSGDCKCTMHMYEYGVNIYTVNVERSQCAEKITKLT